MRLPANGVHAPVAASMVATSQIGSKPERSPFLAARVGTEKVRVHERRARQPPPKLVLPQRRNRLARRIEVVAGVEPIVAEELEEAPGEGVRAGPRRHV